MKYSVRKYDQTGWQTASYVDAADAVKAIWKVLHEHSAPLEFTHMLGGREIQAHAQFDSHGSEGIEAVHHLIDDGKRNELAAIKYHEDRRARALSMIGSVETT